MDDISGSSSSSIFKLPVNSLDLIAWLVFWLYVGRMALWMSSNLAITVFSLVLAPCRAFQLSKINETSQGFEATESSDDDGDDESYFFQTESNKTRKRNDMAADVRNEENDTNSDGSGGVVSLRYMCRMCVVQCNGEAAWKSHVLGKKHQAKNHYKIRMAKGFYWCSYCDADCRSCVNMESLKGKKHLANIQEVVSC